MQQKMKIPKLQLMKVIKLFVITNNKPIMIIYSRFIKTRSDSHSIVNTIKKSTNRLISTIRLRNRSGNLVKFLNIIRSRSRFVTERTRLPDLLRISLILRENRIGSIHSFKPDFNGSRYTNAIQIKYILSRLRKRFRCLNITIN